MRDFKSYKKIVIKIGSALSIDPETYEFRNEWLKSLFADIAKLREDGSEVVLVTSGSVASGCRELNIKRQDLSLTDMHAVASYGQTFLIDHLRSLAQQNNLKIAQVLITSDDCQSRMRYLNTRNTLKRIFNFDLVPVINENDAVVTDEIRFSDNDFLSSRVVQLINADLLIILSDVAGLYDKNPKLHKDAKSIKLVKKFTDDLFELAQEDVLSLGTGGMKSKLNAAKVANKSGCDTLITSGKVLNPLSSYLKRKEGTLFKAQTDSPSAWKSWVLSLRTCGGVIIDAGAVSALKRGKSLLPVGIKATKGRFRCGDPVSIMSESGKKIACGLVTFDVKEVDKIKGNKSEDLAKILGYPCKSVVVHADDLCLL